jgi:hypothetical protein
VSSLVLTQTTALAWHDAGHMVVAQIAYLRLTPAAKRQVDRLLVTEADKRALISYCDKKYNPVTIAVWMDDFKSDSLNDDYAPWHYINYKPLFDGIPERGDAGPEPVNVLDRLDWIINTMRKGTGKDKTDAELLGFLFHLVGDVHQPLHTTTRYTAKQPDGDAGGNGFAIQMPPESRIKNLHSYWDSAAGQFGFESIPRDASGLARIRQFADRIMATYPPDPIQDWKQLDPHQWVEESNAIARRFAYVGIKEGQAPPPSYSDEAKRLCARRIALAGYRLAALLNTIYTEKPTK